MALRKINYCHVLLHAVPDQLKLEQFGQVSLHLQDFSCSCPQTTCGEWMLLMDPSVVAGLSGKLRDSLQVSPGTHLGRGNSVFQVPGRAEG